MGNDNPAIEFSMNYFLFIQTIEIIIGLIKIFKKIKTTITSNYI